MNQLSAESVIEAEGAAQTSNASEAAILLPGWAPCCSAVYRRSSSASSESSPLPTGAFGGGSSQVRRFLRSLIFGHP